MPEIGYKIKVPGSKISGTFFVQSKLFCSIFRWYYLCP